MTGGMEQPAAIAIVILVEVVLVLGSVIAYLAWRLRRTRRALPEVHGLREWLDQTVQHLSADDQEHDPETTRRRRQALEAERQALDSVTGEEREALLARAYALPDNSGGEPERLRRLLQREEKRLRELLTVREELKELRLRYDRVRRLAERLTEGDVPDSQRSPVLETYRKLEGQWLERMGTLENRFEAATGDLELLEEAGTEEPGNIPAGDSGTWLASQAEILTRLRERFADVDSKAVEDLTRLGQQMHEFEASVGMLERENAALNSRLTASSADGSSEEMAQALAMKEREVEALRKQLGQPSRTD